MPRNPAGPAQSAEFGRRVREAREAMRDGAGRKISQERFAHLAELHRTYLGHVERGEVNVALYSIVKIARVLGIDVADLTRGLQDIPDRSAPELKKTPGRKSRAQH